jgi:hypothetical protein
MAPQLSASPSVPLKLAAIGLAVAAVGLPINNLYAYALLAVATLAAFTGLITTSAKRWLAATALALAVLGLHLLAPSPRIEEGHNAFLVDKPGGALEAGLPREAFRIMAAQFDAAYPPAKRCRQGEIACWGFAGLKDRTFAFAADGVFDRPAYSRRVTAIDFDNPIWLRLGFVNDQSVNFLGREGELERLHRDRRSLAIFGRWRLLLPWFVMVRFPAEFAGGKLCWRGEVLWEGANERFARLDHAGWGCRELKADDVGRRMFGVAIEPDANLAMSLDAPWRVTARRALNAGASAIGVIGILLLLLARWRPRRAVPPLLVIGCALIVVVLIDATFVGGFRPLDGGDDGLMLSGFARLSLEALTRGDIMGALRGGEDVYGFTAGMRYFRAIEYLIFGDTFLGYLAVMLVLPLTVFAAGRRFLGVDWAIVFTLAFVATPLGALFGTSYLHYVVWSARGFADPLAAATFLFGLLLLAGPAGVRFDARIVAAFWGAMMLAFAVVLRPNLALGAGVLLAGVGLAALWQGRAARLAALCAGFTPVFFPLWHNWHFGGVVVLFSDILTNANIYVVPPPAYVSALGELLRLNLGGENIGRIAHQLALWLSGPSELRVLIPLHAAAITLLFRVAFSARFEPMLRLTALATIALTPPAFIYMISTRYHLLLWLLTAIVTAAWIKLEGLALLDRRWPQWRARVARNTATARMARGIMWLKGFGFEEQRA